jgi:hypothetical protein
MATRIAKLKPAGQNRVQGGAGDDSQLAGQGHGPGERPRRNANPHSALDDDWIGKPCHGEVPFQAA